MRTRRSDRFQAPAITPLDLRSLETAGLEALLDRKHHEGLRFEGIDISGEDLTGTTFTECELDRVTAQDTHLQGSRLIDSRITQLVAPKIQLRRGTWRGVEVTSSRLGAVEAYDSELSQVSFEGSKLGWLNLRASKLQDVVFRGCRIDELDLSDAALTRVSFEGCTVETLTLNGTRSQHLDLRGLEFSRIEGFEGMRGSRVTERQAIELLDIFAAHLGIEIAG